jgi:hypothetical protein
VAVLRSGVRNREERLSARCEPDSELYKKKCDADIRFIFNSPSRAVREVG